jgi:hypothetical protein
MKIQLPYKANADRAPWFERDEVAALSADRRLEK